MSKVIKGLSINEGIGMGNFFHLKRLDLTVESDYADDPINQLDRYQKAMGLVEEDITKTIKSISKIVKEEDAQIFNAQIAMLNDIELVEKITHLITEEKRTAESAVKEICESYEDLFQSMTQNPYIQSKSQDIRDIKRQMLAKLQGKDNPSTAGIKEDIILVSHDLTPSDLLQIDTGYIKGIVTEEGGTTNHATILARNLSIPFLTDIRVEDIDGTVGIVDAEASELITDPSEQLLSTYQTKITDYKAYIETLLIYKDQQTRMKTGEYKPIYANVASPEDVELAVSNGAEGIGLYRTEFLYMKHNHYPSEDEQFDYYKHALKLMGERPVTIRTLDIGGDKALPYMDLPVESNSFLGSRSIRQSLQNVDVFKTQLRALLRASVHGNLRIMFPLITTLDDIREAKSIYHDVQAELTKEGIAFDGDIQIGMMVEVPSAAIMADSFAKEVDFFSIGTNDLTQYTLAAERENKAVAHYFQPLNPAVLHLMQNTIRAAHDNGIHVGACGESVQDRQTAALYFGMGMDDGSVSSAKILQSRKNISELNLNDLEKMTERILDESRDESDVIDLLTEYLT